MWTSGVHKDRHAMLLFFPVFFVSVCACMRGVRWLLYGSYICDANILEIRVEPYEQQPQNRTEV